MKNLGQISNPYNDDKVIAASKEIQVIADKTILSEKYLLIQNPSGINYLLYFIPILIVILILLGLILYFEVISYKNNRREANKTKDKTLKHRGGARKR